MKHVIRSNLCEKVCEVSTGGDSYSFFLVPQVGVNVSTMPLLIHSLVQVFVLLETAPWMHAYTVVVVIPGTMMQAALVRE